MGAASGSDLRPGRLVVRQLLVTLPLLAWVASVLPWRVLPVEVLGPYRRVDATDTTEWVMPHTFTAWSLGAQPYTDGPHYGSVTAIGIPAALVALTALALVAAVRPEVGGWAWGTAAVAAVGLLLGWLALGPASGEQGDELTSGPGQLLWLVSTAGLAVTALVAAVGPTSGAPLSHARG